MVAAIDKLTEEGCASGNREKLCRARGGESCAFDGAMIVLQPIADTAHLVHGPIACCGNSWEGRGTRSTRGDLHTMGFTTDMSEIDIVYGSEDKLLKAIHRTCQAVRPKAVFVHATCVSGLTGEDINAVCARAGNEIGIPVVPVNAPGFVGPKNLGNRIAGEVLLEHVIGTEEPPVVTHTDINLIGEYNIAGDLWLVEQLLEKAGIRILARITGDSRFEEITWAHRAKLNVVVCGRALVNVARGMESKYSVSFVEASFFGSTEIAKAMRAIGNGLSRLNGPKDPTIAGRINALIKQEEKKLKEALKPYQHLRGKKAVLYTGGVKSWSFISALQDLGIEVVAVGTKKSTAEDEEKMKQILGPDAPLVEDVTPKNLLSLLKDRRADVLIAGGRNQYLAVKEGYPFVDVNQERHRAYAGYQGLVNLAEDISNSLRFYSAECGVRGAELKTKKGTHQSAFANPKSAVVINPLKHSPSIGAAMALQGIDGALPVIHGAQGCTFLGKVLLTRHFREPIALASSKLFVEDVVMGSEDRLVRTIEGFVEKNKPALTGILTSGLTEIKGDDVAATIGRLAAAYNAGSGMGNAQFNEVGRNRRQASSVSKPFIVHIPTPDFEGGLEAGYARAVESVIESMVDSHQPTAGCRLQSADRNINVLAGSHLTPADCNEIREVVEDFGMKSIILPDLSALDGSRQGLSPLAAGGTTLSEINSMGSSEYTIAFGKSLERAAILLRDRTGVEYQVLESAAGLVPVDRLLELLGRISGKAVPRKYQRERRMLVDAMRDAHVFFGGKKACLAAEPDHAVQLSTVLQEMRASVDLAVIPTLSEAADRIRSRHVVIGDFFSIAGKFDLLVSNSHGENTAKQHKVPIYEAGFPVFKSLGYTSKVTVGYRGTMTMINEIGNLLMRGH